MAARLMTVVLEECLERMAQGETMEACLARYPEQAAELKPLLAAANRLEKGAQLRPSAGFKARTRARLVSQMAAHPRGGKSPVRRLPVFSRLAFGLSALLLALAITATALAQSALPGETLYAWKLTSEQVWRAVSPDPAGVDLVLSERRLDEAVAVSGNANAQGVALDGYHKILTNLGHDKNPSDQVRIQAVLKTQQAKYRNAGLPTPARNPTATPASKTPTVLTP